MIAHAVVVASNVDYRVDIDTGSHRIVGDEPVHAGGKDAGPAPYDLVLAGLGACTAITLRMYAARKQWHLGDLRVDLSLTLRDGRARVHRVISSDAALDDEQWTRLLDIASKTPVTRTLSAALDITSERKREP